MNIAEIQLSLDKHGLQLIDKLPNGELLVREKSQLQQKPAACRFCHSEKGCWAWQCYKCGEIDDVQKPTPPAAQRPWVGLTDYEWVNIVNKHDAWFRKRPDEVAAEVAKLVEAMMKDKNHD
tara:strand:+ start:428 stop:790 length:363 start_codon:yes stop_codon:yes gene_type:complete